MPAVYGKMPDWHEKGLLNSGYKKVNTANPPYDRIVAFISYWSTELSVNTENKGVLLV